MSDFGAARGPKASRTKTSPIRSVTHEVLRPVMKEDIAFKMNPSGCGARLYCDTEETKNPPQIERVFVASEGFEPPKANAG